MNKNETEDARFISELRSIIEKARQRAYSAINFAQVEQNWLIGKRIFEQEQNGKARAKYGKQVIKLASEVLTNEFGKGFSERNLKSFRFFYLTFNKIQIGEALPPQFLDDTFQIWEAVPPKFISQNLALLSWTHYERLMRVKNPQIREWYMNEAHRNMWSYRTLDRNINSQYFERILLTHKHNGTEKPVVEEMQELTNEYQLDKFAFIKSPVVVEFLGLPSNTGQKENNLETALMYNLQKFLLELGKGYAFVNRQELIRTAAKDYFVDMVFFNFYLNCFVLIDLKTTKITHQDVGQMDMYVRMYDELKRGEGHNPTIGIVLCAETDQDIAKYSILRGNEQLFASKYMLYMPTEEELRREIEREKELFLIQQNN